MRLRLEGGTRQSRSQAQGSSAIDRRCKEGSLEESLHRGYQKRALRLENGQLRARLYVNARRGKRIQVELKLWRYRFDVARRLHHSLAFPRKDQGGLRQ